MYAQCIVGSIVLEAKRQRNRSARLEMIRLVQQSSILMSNRIDAEP